MFDTFVIIISWSLWLEQNSETHTLNGNRTLAIVWTHRDEAAV